MNPARAWPRVATEGFYVVRPCTTSAGYEARPRKPLRLSLDQAEAALRSAQVEVLRNAGVVLLARAGCDVTVFPTGKLLLKTTSQDEADAATRRIAAALALAD
jgi:hypothetical protein